MPRRSSKSDSRMSRFPLVFVALLLALPLARAHDGGGHGPGPRLEAPKGGRGATSRAKEKDKKAEDAKPDWDVTAQLGPARTWKATLTEGTWIGVDVHPDGKQVAFDLLGDLYVVPLSGGPAKALTEGPAWDHGARWSPDGEQVLYASDRGGNQELWVLDVASGEHRQLSKGAPERFAEGEWSPDGRWIVARKRVTDTRSIGTCELWLLDAKAGSEAPGVKLTDRLALPFPVGATFTAGGDALLFASTPWRFEYGRNPHQGIYDLVRLDLATGEQVRLTGEAGSTFNPAVRPGRDEVAVLRRDGLVTVVEVLDLVSGRRRRLADGIGRDNQEGFALNGVYPHTSWTPDGKELVLWDGAGIVRIDGDTGARAPVPFTAQVEHLLHEPLRFPHDPAASDEVRARMVRWPVVSPDGERVVFEAFGRLWLQPVAGGPASAITGPERMAMHPAWSPDGKRLAYTTWHDVEQGDVRVMTLADGASTVLTDRPSQYHAPSWSPDGRRMTWLRGSGAAGRGHDTGDELWYRIELAELGPALEARVVDVMAWGWTGGNVRARPAPFSADGARLLLVEDEDRGEANTAPRLVLRSVTLEGHDPRVLVRWEAASEAVVSPDGGRVAWVEGHRVYVADLPPGTAGQAVDLGASGGATPATRLGEGSSGSFVGWAGSEVTWAMGPTLHVGDRAVRLEAQLPRVHGTGRTCWTHARVLTMTANGVLEDATVIVEGERIVGVGTGLSTVGCTVVDATGKTIMPGLIDVHAHLHYGASDALPQASWVHRVNLAFGVTTVHDPSAHDDTAFASAERIEAGLDLGPRVYSTGRILYGAKDRDRSEVASLEDAVEHVRRQKALGAISVKSYQQPSRSARQQVIQAARQEEILVVPEGGGDLAQDLTLILDGHTSVEHTIPKLPRADVIGLYAASGVAFVPTLLVSYGGLAGENYYYQTSGLLADERLARFAPADWLARAGRRRDTHVMDQDWFFKELSRSIGEIAKAGGLVALGAHGQVQGLGPHWELWAMAEGMGNEAALRAATYNGAVMLGMDRHLGSVATGRLADLIVIDGNPLADIRDSVKVTEVVTGGRRFDARTLDPL